MNLSITKEELTKMLLTNTPVMILDVRDKEEYLAQHLPFAGNIPIKIIEAGLFIPEPGKKVITVCGKGGGRSEKAAIQLRSDFHTEAYFLEGGTFGFYL